MMKSKSRIVRIHELKAGDRFTFIPAAWYGPGVVKESYGTRSLLGKVAVFNDFPLSRDRKNYVSGVWCIKFDNDKVVNPPGVDYSHPETRVRLLNS
jgi:hypothetical protein